MGKFTYTDLHLAFLRVAYKTMTRRQVCEAFNERFGESRPPASVIAALKNHQIRSGRTGRFEPGQESWNKGTHYTPGGKAVATQFKRGNKPKTWVPVGTEVTDADGYLKRKVRDDAPPGQSRFNWKFVHVLVWEQAHGPVPDGCMVSFRDGKRANCNLDNLVLLRRAEGLYLNRNGYREMPGELRQPMRNLARVEARRHELEKKT